MDTAERDFLALVFPGEYKSIKASLLATLGLPIRPALEGRLSKHWKFEKSLGAHAGDGRKSCLLLSDDEQHHSRLCRINGYAGATQSDAHLQTAYHPTQSDSGNCFFPSARYLAEVSNLEER